MLKGYTRMETLRAQNLITSQGVKAITTLLAIFLSNNTRAILWEMAQERKLVKVVQQLENPVRKCMMIRSQSIIINIIY